MEATLDIGPFGSMNITAVANYMLDLYLGLEGVLT